MARTTKLVTIVVSSPTSGLPTWLTSAVNQWMQVPVGAASLASVAPSPTPPGGTGVNSVVDTWCGAALRPTGSHYLLHGGGHGDYAGNEIYALQLNANTPGWIRKWGPTPNAQIAPSVRYYGDGNPAAIHTMYTLVYDPVRDRMFRAYGGRYVDSGYDSNVDSWTWGAANWNPAGTHPDSPVAYAGYGGHCRHTVTGDVYSWMYARRGIWRSATNTWQTITTGDNSQLEYANIAYDPVRDCMWTNLGTYGAANTMYRWDCTSASSQSTVVSVTGLPKLSAYSTIVYDSNLAVFWLMDYSAPNFNLYQFNPTTLVVTTHSPVGGVRPTTTVTPAGAPCGRLQYVPELKGLVIQPNWSSPTWFMRTA